MSGHSHHHHHKHHHHRHHGHGDDDHHHGHGDGDHHHHHRHHHDEEHVQCNHEEGIGKLNNCDFLDDPLFQKKDWTLDDWIAFTERMPSKIAKGKPSPKLLHYASDILPSGPGRVLVPLCGKTPDLRWFYDRGNTVVGIEGVEKLIREFFEAHSDLSHTVEELSFGKLYKTTDDRLQIYVCDITKIPPETLGKFDAVFDWGSYSAVHKDGRKKYVEIMTGALKEDYRYFLELCHDGPPDAKFGASSISLREVKLDFGSSHQIRILETKDIAKVSLMDSLFNSYILMSPVHKN